MSAGFKERDSIIAILKCWHGLETIVKAIGFDAMTQAGAPFGFSVTKQPIEHYVDGVLTDTVPDKVKLVDQDGRIVSVVGSEYGIVQPERFAEMVINSMVDIDHDIQTCLTLDNRRKLIVSVKLNESENANDGLLSHLIFSHSLDGTSRGKVWDSIVNVVCANTLAMAMRDLKNGGINLSFSHSKNVMDRIPDVEMAVQELAESRKQTIDALLDAKNHALSVEDANKVIAGWQGSTSTRAETVRNDIVGLFQNGIGNKGENAFDLINGVTEYYTHHLIGDKVDNRDAKTIASSEFGTGAKYKASFVDSITVDNFISDELLNKLADKGDAVLKEREKVKVTA